MNSIFLIDGDFVVAVPRLNLSVAAGDFWTGLYRERGTWWWTDGTSGSLTSDLLNLLNLTFDTAMLVHLPGVSFSTAGLESQQTGVICKRAVPGKILKDTAFVPENNLHICVHIFT